MKNILDEHLITVYFSAHREALRKKFVKEISFTLVFLLVFAPLLYLLFSAQSLIWNILGIAVAIFGVFEALGAFISVSNFLLDYKNDSTITGNENIEYFIKKVDIPFSVKFSSKKELEEIPERLFEIFPPNTPVHVIRGEHSRAIIDITLRESE